MRRVAVHTGTAVVSSTSRNFIFTYLLNKLSKTFICLLFFVRKFDFFFVVVLRKCIITHTPIHYISVLMTHILLLCTRTQRNCPVIVTPFPACMYIDPYNIFVRALRAHVTRGYFTIAVYYYNSPLIWRHGSSCNIYIVHTYSLFCNRFGTINFNKSWDPVVSVVPATRVHVDVQN